MNCCIGLCVWNSEEGLPYVFRNIEKIQRGNQNLTGPRQTNNWNQMTGSKEAHAQMIDMLIAQTNKNQEVHLE